MNAMIQLAKTVYGRLPPVARSTAASAYGYYLRAWRYGRETDRLVDLALARESWTPEQWAAYRSEHLATLLHRAATHVPYYRDHWKARRGAGDHSSSDDLRNWPVLDKKALREDPAAFVADDVDAKRLFRLNTSGTSGSPITLWRSLRTTREWYALLEARCRKWYGVDRHMRWAILGGQVVTPAAQDAPPFWVWNAGLKQLYMSTLHLTERHAAAYVSALREHRIEHMYGYASSMYWLATIIKRSGLTAPRLTVAISNAEPFLAHQRAIVSEVFGCPVRDSYGMAEIAAAASECDHGAMHVWPDAGIIEVIDDEADDPVPFGTTGRFVCTSLLNHDMPLIRYEVGDRGALRAPSAEPCACGRSLQVVERLEGRVSDNLVAADGRRVFWINPVFYELPVAEAQVIQEALDLVRVHVVPAASFDDAVGETIAQRLRQRLGDVRVEVERIDQIPRGANGKFKPVVNRVDASGTVDTPAT